jgi:hypothetical protein
MLGNRESKYVAKTIHEVLPSSTLNVSPTTSIVTFVVSSIFYSMVRHIAFI